MKPFVLCVSLQAVIRLSISCFIPKYSRWSREICNISKI